MDPVALMVTGNILMRLITTQNWIKLLFPHDIMTNFILLTTVQRQKKQADTQMEIQGWVEIIYTVGATRKPMIAGQIPIIFSQDSMV